MRRILVAIARLHSGPQHGQDGCPNAAECSSRFAFTPQIRQQTLDVRPAQTAQANRAQGREDAAIELRFVIAHASLL
jgi:hypothetical protein